MELTGTATATPRSHGLARNEDQRAKDASPLQGYRSPPYRSRLYHPGRGRDRSQRDWLAVDLWEDLSGRELCREGRGSQWVSHGQAPYHAREEEWSDGRVRADLSCARRSSATGVRACCCRFRGDAMRHDAMRCGGAMRACCCRRLGFLFVRLSSPLLSSPLLSSPLLSSPLLSSRSVTSPSLP